MRDLRNYLGGSNLAIVEKPGIQLGDQMFTFNTNFPVDLPEVTSVPGDRFYESDISHRNRVSNRARMYRIFSERGYGVILSRAVDNQMRTIPGYNAFYVNSEIAESVRTLYASNEIRLVAGTVLSEGSALPVEKLRKRELSRHISKSIGSLGLAGEFEKVDLPV